MRCRLVFVPSLFRQELILYLKKAKAVCGSAGFRGKQIPDVVQCVEDLVELEVLLIFPYLHSAILILSVHSKILHSGTNVQLSVRTRHFLTRKCHYFKE